MNSDAIFLKAPAILIHLDEARDVVVCHSYSMDGKPHDNVGLKILNPNKLPLLLFQLVTGGYWIQPYEAWPNMFIAMSRDYVMAHRMVGTEVPVPGG